MTGMGATGVGMSRAWVSPASGAPWTRAKLVIYPQVGHLPQIEIPRRSAADVAEFLQRTPALAS